MPPRARKSAASKAGGDKAGVQPGEHATIVGYEPEFPLDELAPFYKNPRRGDVEAIRGSLRTNGQYRPLVVNIGTHTKRPNEILAGNHTYAALKAEKRLTAAVTFVDVDEQGAKRIVIADNATSDKAKNDADVLKDLLVSLDDIEGTGITPDEFAKMLGQGDDDVDTSAQLGDVGYAIIVDCTDEAQQAELLSTFEEEGLDARPLMM